MSVGLSIIKKTSQLFTHSHYSNHEKELCIICFEDGLKKYNYQWNIKKNLFYDGFFFIFPFWISLLYFFLLKIVGDYDNLIFLITYVLLAETHFASTWTSYLDPVNISYFKQRAIIFYYIPLFIIIFVIIISFFFGVKNVFMESKFSVAIINGNP